MNESSLAVAAAPVDEAPPAEVAPEAENEVESTSAAAEETREEQGFGGDWVPETVHVPKNVIIINPTAGKGRGDKIIDEIREYLGDDAEEWGWYMTSKPGHAEQIATAAAQLKAPVVIAVGGDGTVNEVVNGIYNSESTLAIIPAGNSNNLAHALGIGEDIKLACETIANGDTINIDVGAVKGNKTGGGRAFLVQAGTGFTAWSAMRDPKGPLGGAIPTLTKFKPFKLTTTENEVRRTTEATFITFVNAPTAAGAMRVAPRAILNDGVLEVCTLGNVNQLQLMTLLPQLSKGKYVQHAALKMAKTSMMEISADPPQPLTIDGEVLGTTPATFWIVPNSLPVKVPRK